MIFICTLVLRPVNLRTEFFITLKPKEHQYERSTLLLDIQVSQVDFHADMKQLSDVLDFIKFQKYTTIHGILHEIFDNLVDFSEQRSMSRIS